MGGGGCHHAACYTRSATVPSIRWKNISPPTRIASTATDEASISSFGGCPCPVSAHRKPSITPAIGFSPYSQRHLSGTRLLGYATGDASIQNCTTNGNTYPTSRYSAFSADSHNPTPKAVANDSNTKNGSHTACAPGRNPYFRTSASSTTNEMAKSTRPDTTPEIGKIDRGK